jgi:hypothetical protein
MADLLFWTGKKGNYVRLLTNQERGIYYCKGKIEGESRIPICKREILKEDLRFDYNSLVTALICLPLNVKSDIEE